MIERIQALEEVARRLEPDAAGRHAVRETVVAHGEDFLESLEDGNAYEIDKSGAHLLLGSPISEEPSDIGPVLALFRDAVTKPGLNPASGGHLGYIPGGGLYYSALGDYLADVTNEYAGVSFAGPGAVQLENQLLDWMAGMVGYPTSAEGGGGNLASGGSIANLIAIVTARDTKGLKPKDYDRAVVYLSEHVHHCLDKALRIAGLECCHKRYIRLDERYRMEPDDLARAIGEDRAAGRIPWLVIASAGTTDVGAVDPLAELGAIAHEHDLWYHVDGAYGAFFALAESAPASLAGMAASDSVVMDPHKGLFLPYGLGAVLVRDKGALHRSHYYQANYMQDAQRGEERVIDSPAELSPELTKPFRGLRLWLPLKLHGVAPFRAGLEEKLLLTRHFYEEVQKLGFEVGPEPELSVATFRWVPEEGDANAFNRALVEQVHNDGRVFLSSTTLDGRVVLRFAALAFRTHLSTVERTLSMLRDALGRVSSALRTK
ncbi:MAG: aminotransferase class V-fold PLP-dependent enzyme [Planctomycetota bacterium]